jgi:hypothetical protein
MEPGTYEGTVVDRDTNWVLPVTPAVSHLRVKGTLLEHTMEALPYALAAEAKKSTAARQRRTRVGFIVGGSENGGDEVRF